MVDVIFTFTKMEVPDYLRPPALRPSTDEMREQEKRRKDMLSTRHREYFGACREALQKVLEDIEPERIGNLPNLGAISITGLSPDERDRIEKKGKEMGVISGAISDKPTELIESKTSEGLLDSMGLQDHE